MIFIKISSKFHLISIRIRPESYLIQLERSLNISWSKSWSDRRMISFETESIIRFSTSNSLKYVFRDIFLLFKCIFGLIFFIHHNFGNINFYFLYILDVRTSLYIYRLRTNTAWHFKRSLGIWLGYLMINPIIFSFYDK